MDAPLEEKSESHKVNEWMTRQLESSEISLSVVIPAYNEETRLPSALIDVIDFLDLQNRSYEVLVVDDGSMDATSEVVKKFEKIRPQVRLIRLGKNGGKGLAVKTGMLSARGALVLYCDADGATPIQELASLETAIQEGAQIAFGSRAISSSRKHVEALWYRKIMGRVFNFVVNTLVLPGVADTQCGFKLFTAKSAQTLFPLQTLEGFGFDVELLYLAKRLHLPMREVAVNWNNRPGSKVNIIRDSLRMFFEIVLVRIRHQRKEG